MNLKKDKLIVRITELSKKIRSTVRITELSKKMRVTIIVLTVLIITASVLAIVFYQKSRTATVDPLKMNEQKIDALVMRVGKLIDLPVGERPANATISDTKSLQGNEFFLNAKIGDEVLVYGQSRKAYLYDPRANIVIDAISLK